MKLLAMLCEAFNCFSAITSVKDTEKGPGLHLPCQEVAWWGRSCLAGYLGLTGTVASPAAPTSLLLGAALGTPALAPPARLPADGCGIPQIFSPYGISKQMTATNYKKGGANLAYSAKSSSHEQENLGWVLQSKGLQQWQEAKPSQIITGFSLCSCILSWHILFPRSSPPAPNSSVCFLCGIFI